MTPPRSQLTDGFSIEITGRDADALLGARAALPDATRVNVTFLAHETTAMRVAAAEAVRQIGLTPIPHVSARRLGSEAELRGFLAALAGVDATASLLVVSGDPPEPAGPYEDALSVIRSGVLADYGVTHVGIGGYPEGHPDIADDKLWQGLTDKTTALAEAGIAGEIVTQFGFDAEAVVSWIEQVRARSVELPIRVGVPGPAGVKRLLGYAKRFGVGSSAQIAKKYGLSLTNLLAVTGPDRFVDDLAARLDPAVHGAVALHFYTFGGVGATADWVAAYTHHEKGITHGRQSATAPR